MATNLTRIAACKATCALGTIRRLILSSRTSLSHFISIHFKESHLIRFSKLVCLALPALVGALSMQAAQVITLSNFGSNVDGSINFHQAPFTISINNGPLIPTLPTNDWTPILDPVPGQLFTPQEFVQAWNANPAGSPWTIAPTL